MTKLNSFARSALLLAMLGSSTVAGVARAEGGTGRNELGVCQHVFGPNTSTCDARTAFTINKSIVDGTFEQPTRSAVEYKIKVTEGTTRYLLGMTSTVELDGRIPEGTQVRGIIASLQKKSPADEGFTSVASQIVGNADPTCGCPYVGSADLQVTLRDEDFDVVPIVGENLIENLGFGEIYQIQLDAVYDLAAGIVQPGDQVRLQACVQWAVADDADVEGCFVDGGATRLTKACSLFDFPTYASPTPDKITVHEELQQPEQDWVVLNGFHAISYSPTVTPHNTGLIGLQPYPDGSSGLVFEVQATGQPGTESIIQVTGDVSCGQHVTCEPDATLCFGEIWNDAVMDYDDDRGSFTSSVRAEVVCRPFSCLPGDIAACDDDDPCTVDTCIPNVGCSNTPHTGACDDGDPCTTGETCATGICMGGSPTQCGGGTACTSAVCDPEIGCVTLPRSNTTPCSDGSACTVEDHCQDGTCVAGMPVTCNDGNPCTADACNPTTGCVAPAVAPNTPCTDNNICTNGDLCQGTVCTAGPTLGCDDGNPCTIDSCNPSVPGGCVHTPAPATTSCDDGNACTIDDTCGNGTGQCKPGRVKLCNDGNTCTNDLCDPQAGCFFPPRTGSCDDNNACTSASMCQNGTCTATANVDCNDGNSCTTDACNTATGCTHGAVANGIQCDDGNPCSSGDSCQSGVCVSQTQTVCDDNNQCTTSTCLPDEGCVHVPRSGSCEDGNACTGPDACDASVCRSGGNVDCDDHNPCTTDSCDPATGCKHQALNAGGCDDGDPCTSPGMCQAGACVQQLPVDCNDNNACTADSCTPGVGCQHPAVSGACDDGDPCTGNGTCSAGVCQPGSAIVCNDGNDCTADFCRAGVGCQTLARNNVPCSDGSVCTNGDMCQTGVCIPGPQLDCNDNNPCTDDSCGPSGCTHTPKTNNFACEDGNACTLGDTCQAGICTAGAPKSCSDNNSCTTDTCNSLSGVCGHDTRPDGVTCDNGDACNGCPWPEDVINGWHALDAPPDTTILPPSTPTGLLDLQSFESGARVVMTAQSGTRFIQLTATTAALRGRLTAGGVDWDISLSFVYRGTGPAGQGTAGPVRELGTSNQSNAYTDHWGYWTLQSGGTLTRVSNGELVVLAPDPAFANAPLQIGERANGRNLGPGLSLPIRYTRNSQSNSAMLRANIQQVFCRVPDRCQAGVCNAGTTDPECRELQVGDYCTYLDSEYGARCTATDPTSIGCKIAANFPVLAVETPTCSSATVYAFGFTTFRRYAFSTATAVEVFLPSNGTFLTTAVDLCNPASSSGSKFVSKAMSLDMSIVLSDSGVLPAPNGISLGELMLVSGACQGYSLRQLAQRAEQLADGITPPGTTCRDTTTVETVITSVLSGFRLCQGIAADVGLPD